jgi:hypothetical protein
LIDVRKMGKPMALLADESMKSSLLFLLLLLPAGCLHASDQAIVDNCRAGGGLTVKACECVRSEMKASMNDYAYAAMVLLANGRDEEAGSRLNGLTQRDQVAVAGAMMTSYAVCGRSGGGDAL